MKEYPGTGHSFLTNTEVPAPFAPILKIVLGLGAGRENADDGWRRIFAFFDRYLAGEPEIRD